MYPVQNNTRPAILKVRSVHATKQAVFRLLSGSPKSSHATKLLVFKHSYRYCSRYHWKNNKTMQWFLEMKTFEVEFNKHTVRPRIISFFYKQPVYKQLDLGCAKNKQLSGLTYLTISNFLIYLKWKLIKLHNILFSLLLKEQSPSDVHTLLSVVSMCIHTVLHLGYTQRVMELLRNCH